MYFQNYAFVTTRAKPVETHMRKINVLKASKIEISSSSFVMLIIDTGSWLVIHESAQSRSELDGGDYQIQYHSYSQTIRRPGINQLTPRAYCDIPAHIEVRVWKEGGRFFCKKPT